MELRQEFPDTWFGVVDQLDPLDYYDEPGLALAIWYHTRAEKALCDGIAKSVFRHKR